MKYDFNTTEACAKTLDEQDSLAEYRSKFFIPKNKIYVDGNSLGLMPKPSETSLLRIIDEWKTSAIDGWLDADLTAHVEPHSVDRTAYGALCCLGRGLATDAGAPNGRRPA